MNQTPDNLRVLANQGMRHLFIRQIFTTAVTFAGGVVLARVLSPAEFGIYAIATFLVNVFMIFGDLGLGASFVQNPTPPSNRQLQVSFTVQFSLVTIVVLLTWVLAPLMVRPYPALGPGGVWLCRAVAFLLYLPVLRSMSAVQLERRMDYKPLAWAEGVGISLYQIVAVVCAVNGFGIWSFVFATVIAGIVGLAILYRSAPWPPGLCYDIFEIHRVLKYGISFQSTTILDAIAQWTTPAIVGVLAGPHAVGYLGVAQANARRPLMLAESVMRVSFSHFSRMQDEIQKLHDTVTNYLVGFLWVMLLWTGFLWTSASPLVEIIYSEKWLPAVPALVIFAVALPLDMIIWAMSLCYRAMNRNWSAVKIFGARTMLMLVIAAFVIPQIGFLGMPWAYLVANMVCALLLLKNFASGFLTKVVRSCAWLIPGVIIGTLCARIAMPAAGTSHPVVHLFAGAVPFTLAYLIVSLVLAPERYRYGFVQKLVDVFPVLRHCAFNSAAPRPESLLVIAIVGLLSAVILAGPAAPVALATGLQQAAERTESYALGANDQVSIQALDAEEISGKAYTVSPTGHLTLPMIGRFKVMGLTVEEVEAQLIEALKVYIRQPEVAVTVTEFHSQPVSVIGAVNNPGLLQLQGTKTLIEVLSMAGGLRSDAGHTLMITRKQEWGVLPLPGAQIDAAGQVSISEIQLRDVLEARDPEQNITIRANDIISVPRAEVIYVLGAVNKAGGFMLNERGVVSVLQALSLAEGLQRTSAPQKAVILRADGTPRRSEIPVDIAEIFSGRTEDIVLQPNDILFVPDSSGKRIAARVLEALFSMGTAVGTGTIIYRR